MITTKTVIVPMGNRILVKLLAPPDKIGDLWTPEVAKNRSVEGEVVSVGMGGQKTNWTGDWPPVREGDKVLMGKWAGQSVEMHDLRGEPIYYIIGVDEILAILRG